MPARYLKPQTPLEQGTDYVYPVTTLDQVIGSDGSTRLNTEVESIKSDIATIETSSTAAHSYAIGQYLVYNNTLYKATKAISVGATLVVGNNIQATSVGTELKSLNDSFNTSITNINNTFHNQTEWNGASFSSQLNGGFVNHGTLYFYRFGVIIIVSGSIYNTNALSSSNDHIVLARSVFPFTVTAIVAGHFIGYAASCSGNVGLLDGYNLCVHPREGTVPANTYINIMAIGYSADGAL